MTAFTLNTSGRVAGDIDGLAVWYEFEDLDPFTQGYVEALFASACADLHTGHLAGHDRIRFPAGHPRAFSDLSPEALAMILRDCADNTREFIQPRGFSEVSRNNGRHLWSLRQAGFWPERWPKVTVTLGEDGKVTLTAKASPQTEETS